MRSAVRGSFGAFSLGVFCAVTIVCASPAAFAQVSASDRGVFVFTVGAATLEDLLATPGLSALAERGGAALLVMSEGGDALNDLSRSWSGDGKGVLPFWRGGDLGTGASSEQLSSAADRAASVLDGSSVRDALCFFVSNDASPKGGLGASRLGAVVMAHGPAHDLASALRTAAPSNDPNTLTSDSTRRHGVVTSRDIAETASTFAGTRALETGGSIIRIVDGPPPTELYDRYVQSKQLTVPIGVAAALYATIASLIAIIALWRPDVSRRHRGFCASLAISVPFVALSLLLVGHLPSLTYAMVVPFLIATTALATVALTPAARRWGTLGAIAAAGVILLGALVVEAALGWSAALTPLLGGSQLDGGRFFGLPNAFIGLLLGGSLYVAQRLPRTNGTVLIAAAGLFAGSPWTGSNIGAAVTLFCAAGIWWGVRGELGWWRTAIATVAAIASGTILVVVAHRYLTSAATHITRFSEHSGGVAGLWDKFMDRLGVGVDLITDNPFALLPVLGVLVMLGIVLRPPGPIRRSFDVAPAWRLALLTIVVGSVVAYVVNDSGAAAVGEGLTTSLAGMLYVSLRLRDDMMTS